MKFLTCILLLMVVVCSISSASAASHQHDFTGADEEKNNFFPMYSDVTDEVTSVFDEGYTTMDFTWYESGGFDFPRQFATGYSTGEGTFVNIYDGDMLDEEGVWKVTVVEYLHDSEGHIVDSNDNGMGTFHVMAAPEFSYGAVIVVLFGSFLYLMMRRSVLGSLNVQQ